MIDPADILKGKILIVDDTDVNVMLLERTLGAAGYTSVSSTRNPGEVFELHRKNRYDLILLDIEMPGLDGFQVMEGLKEIDIGNYLSVLVLTAYPAHKLRALQSGAKDFISKPFDLAEVVMRVRNMLEVRLLHEVLRKHTKELDSDLSNLLANIDIPIVLLNDDLTVRRFTPPAETVLGLSSEQIGRSISSVRLPLALSNLEPLLMNVMKTGDVQKMEIQDARGRWYYLFLRPYRTEKNKTENNRIEGVVIALVDIHDRKLSEKTLLRLATLVLDSNDAVIVCDLQDRIIAWNKGAQKMYGYTERQALGMRIRRLMPKDKLIKARELIRVSAAPFEAQRRTRDGRILDVLLTVTVLRDDKGQPVEVATTERDITEQKHGEREFQRLRARVISAQETERKRLALELHDGVGQILSGVKYRLQALQGNMTLSKGDEAKILKVGGFLDHAISEIRRVSQNLMPSELVDLGLEAALLMLCREFKERVGIHVTIRTVPTEAAPEQALALFRITQEALNNIGKHSKADQIAVNLLREGKEIVLSVRDNGIGFNLVAGRSSTERGIGLVSMRERAESIGGAITIQSAPGAGTTLVVRAPVTSPRRAIQ